ncbi:porin [Noviherbaspirillum cavernae]|uniref:Porin n=1 Tax=Noviherbaspirillum cavernae TaxID=2320862 RepID=A0A418X3D3_9BURK|nr:porin [Noviherbaspirillum cavernae]RJG06925.1 porin [Noviherbaspirillum cavernae]
MRVKILASLVGSLFALPAAAQTSIQIYGIVDGGVQISDFGGGKQYNLASGIAEGSRIGFSGSEDLGGGYKAIFTLESRFEVDTGDNKNGFIGKNPAFALMNGAPLPPSVSLAIATALGQNNAVVNSNGALFDRTAQVGLVTPIGGFLFGRQYTPAYEVFAMADTFETGSAGGWGSIAGGIGSLYTPGVAIRVNNAMQYRIELPSGFGASLMYSPEKNATGSLGVSERFLAGGVRYKAKGFNVGIAYNTEDNATGSKSLTSTVIGGSYGWGDFRFYAGYMKMKNDNPSLATALGPTITAALGPAGAPLVPGTLATLNSNARLDGSTYTLGMHYRIGAGRLMGALSRTTDDIIANANVTMISLGYDYNMSKRTDLYIFYAHANNQSNAQYALGGGGYGGGFTTQRGENANALQLGMRHRF